MAAPQPRILRVVRHDSRQASREGLGPQGAGSPRHVLERAGPLREHGVRRRQRRATLNVIISACCLGSLLRPAGGVDSAARGDRQSAHSASCALEPVQPLLRDLLPREVHVDVTVHRRYARPAKRCERVSARALGHCAVDPVPSLASTRAARGWRFMGLLALSCLSVRKASAHRPRGRLGHQRGRRSQIICSTDFAQKNAAVAIHGRGRVHSQLVQLGRESAGGGINPW